MLWTHHIRLRVLCGCLVQYGVWFFVTPGTVACQASQSMEYPRQEYWSGLPFPFLGDPPGLGIEPASPTLQADSLLQSHRRRPIMNVKSK